MSTQDISADFPFAINHVNVGHGAEMAYIDTDPARSLEGPPVVFMHGNPAYSYLWRNIIPHVSPKSRCIAPDLVGMGSSSKLPSEAYGWDNHNRYLDEFFSQVIGSGKVVLVLHYFGSLFGLNWARHHPQQVAGLIPENYLKSFITHFIGSPDNLRKAIIDGNVFIELFMQDQVIRTLSPTELHHYRKPFLDPANRESLYEMAKIFPVAGNPPEVYQAVKNYNSWLLENEIPRLFFWADPGKIMLLKLSRYYSENLKNVKSISVGNAKHYLQEDHPHLIGSEIDSWLEMTGISHGKK